MKKTLLVIIAILVTLITMAIVTTQNNIQAERELLKFNSEYEKYLEDDTILGTEIATLIGKAIDNNEKNNIEKNEKGVYISDDEYSLKVYIRLLGSSEDYEMEAINKLGISRFISNFNISNFTCTKINYHEKTKRVSEIYIKELAE